VKSVLALKRHSSTEKDNRIANLAESMDEAHEVVINGSAIQLDVNLNRKINYRKQFLFIDDACACIGSDHFVLKWHTDKEKETKQME